MGNIYVDIHKLSQIEKSDKEHDNKVVAKFKHGTITLIDLLGTKSKSKEDIEKFVSKIKKLHKKLEIVKKDVNRTFSYLNKMREKLFKSMNTKL